MLDDLKIILSNLYSKYGLTDDILRLSQLIDTFIVGEMNEKLFK